MQPPARDRPATGTSDHRPIRRARQAQVTTFRVQQSQTGTTVNGPDARLVLTSGANRATVSGDFERTGTGSAWQGVFHERARVAKTDRGCRSGPRVASGIRIQDGRPWP